MSTSAPMQKLDPATRIVIPGAAGLVGHNLLIRLQGAGCKNVVALDNHPTNLRHLRELTPDVEVVEADLAEPGAWQEHVSSADVVVMLQARIAATDPGLFERDNVVSTRNVLEAMQRGSAPYVLHLSSSVVRSQADDAYTQSKRRQEELVVESGLDYCILRPTLMFGWFDRKHLGWLRQFLAKSPLFPVPGNGEFIRQPLFVGDFCDIVIACMNERPEGEVFDISGLEEITYIEIIRTIKRVVNKRTPIIKLPYAVFWGLLWLAGKVWRTPPFTTGQLEALVIPETFPVFDWPGRFGIHQTPFEEAIRLTFLDPENADVELEF
jgi:nucleoside-diphosphate-sugar epimerase